MLSAVVLTKNEKENIKDCLVSLSFCGEIIVIDDESSDKTAEIAEKYGAKVFSRALNGNFSSQRNFGLEKTSGDWVLFVDADERVTPALQKEILKLISSQILLEQNLCGFYIRRVDFLWGRELKHGETGNTKILRLAKRNSGQWQGKVHETWKIKGRTSELTNPLLHYPHKTIKEFLEDINFYTDLRARELYMTDIQVYLPSIIFYPLGKFLVNYFLKRGFQDGMPGLILAMMMSFHSFLVRGKLWLLWQKNI